MEELNAAVGELLEKLNTRPFQKREGCRRSAFEQLDCPAMKPLPARRYEIGAWKINVGVNVDHHLESLRKLPGGGVSQKEACALIDAAGFVPPKDQYLWDADGSLVARTTNKKAVISCAKRVADGPGHFLVPTFRCGTWRPYCEFGMLSGETSVPPMERRYWFDVTGAKLRMTAVALPGS